jgi:quercetin dioxygenase-like cupin family protein
MSEAARRSELFDRNLPHDRREALFGGTGAVRVWSLVDTPMLPFKAVLACELEAGGSVGSHVQDHYPEIVIGISGQGKAFVEGLAAQLVPGAVIELPRGYTLAIENESTDSALRYLIIKSERHRSE